MKHITEEYGMETNELSLSWDEYAHLEPFLIKLGVRTRAIISDRDGLIIQGENPYRTWANHPKCKEIADEAMDDLHIKCYKR